jgi:hypothetical protein
MIKFSLTCKGVGEREEREREREREREGWREGEREIIRK